MNGILAFLAGVASAIGIAWLHQNNQSFRSAADQTADTLQQSSNAAANQVRNAASVAGELASTDLNSCSREDLMGLGLSEDLANRVVENRPYRNKLDLISRLVIPEDAYNTIKQKVGVEDGTSDEPIRVAS